MSKKDIHHNGIKSRGTRRRPSFWYAFWSYLETSIPTNRPPIISIRFDWIGYAQRTRAQEVEWLNVARDYENTWCWPCFPKTKLIPNQDARDSCITGTTPPVCSFFQPTKPGRIVFIGNVIQYKKWKNTLEHAIWLASYTKVSSVH